MRLRITLSFLLLITFGSRITFAAPSKNHSVLQVEKNKYLILQFAKFDETAMAKLIGELKSYENKILEVSFNSENHQLMIYYTSAIKLDDIYQIVLIYFSDFEKIGGTEL